MKHLTGPNGPPPPEGVDLRLELVEHQLTQIAAGVERIEAHAAAMETLFEQLSATFGDLGGLADLMPGGLGALMGNGRS